MMTHWVRRTAAVLALFIAGANGWGLYRAQLERGAQEGRAHAVAAYRIDPSAADRLVGDATRRCLRNLLPHGPAGAAVPAGLTEAFVVQVRFGAGWREGMDVERFNARWVAETDAAQARYNARWAAMDAPQAAVARQLRRAIVAGSDPRACIYRAVARGAPAIYVAPDGRVALRGALVAVRHP